MRIRTFVLALLLALSATLRATPADAQSPSSSDTFTDTARKRFAEGVQLYDRGKYEEACAAFLQAYALKKHPAVLLNLAQSELRSGRPVEAARHFAMFLRDNPDAHRAERTSAQEGLVSARTKTGRLDVTVSVSGADVFIDGEAVGRSPLPEAVDVAPGARQIEVKLHGYRTVTQQAYATAGSVEPMRITMVPDGGELPEPEPVPAAEADAPVARGVTLSTDGRKPFHHWVVDDKIAWLTGGATVVGVVVGALFSFAARSASDNADSIAGKIKLAADGDPDLGNRRSNPCADPIPLTARANYRPACDRLKDNLDARDTDVKLATVGWIIGGAGALATGILYFVRADPDGASDSRSARGTPTMAAAPVLGPHLGGFTIGGTF